MESLASLFTSTAGAGAYGAAGTTYALPTLAADTGFTAATAAQAGGYAATAGTAGLTAAEIANLGAAGLQIAGTAVSTSAAADQAAQQAKEGEIQGRNILTEREFARRAEELQNKRIIARNRAVAGAGNVDPFSGSPLEMELYNAFEARMNRNLGDYGADLAAGSARRGAAFTRGTIPGIYAGGALQAGASALGSMYRMYNPSPYTRLGSRRGLYNP